LTTEQRRTGVTDELYTVREEAPFAGELAELRGENKAQVEAFATRLTDCGWSVMPSTLTERAIPDSRNNKQKVVPGTA
jgi:hypothetical protein